jgi:hypothetical protein
MGMYHGREDFLIYDGDYFKAEWYYTREGHMPAYDYYSVPTLGDAVRRRFLEYVKLYCDTKPGIILPKTIYGIEDKLHKIYALKPKDERFFNFTTEGSVMIITNAYRKHSQKMTKKDIDVMNTAIRYREDYIQRLKEGVYYER